MLRTSDAMPFFKSLPPPSPEPKRDAESVQAVGAFQDEYDAAMLKVRRDASDENLDALLLARDNLALAKAVHRS